MSDKLKATVIISEVSEPKSGTSRTTGKPWKAFTFKATCDGKERTYKTMSTSIGDQLNGLINKEVEIEYEEKESDYGTERNVSQMWVEGKPLRSDEKKQWNGSGYQSKDNPEARASIEAQVAVKCITELEVAGKEIADDLRAARDNWMRQVLHVQAEAHKEPKKPIAETETGIDMKTAGDLFTLALKQYKWNQTRVLKELGASKPADIKNLQRAWETIQELAKLGEAQ